MNREINRPTPTHAKLRQLREREGLGQGDRSASGEFRKGYEAACKHIDELRTEILALEAKNQQSIDSTITWLLDSARSLTDAASILNQMKYSPKS